MNLLPTSLSTQVAPDPATLAFSTLAAWNAMAKNAYSAKTRRAQRADGAVFRRFCEGMGFSFLPAEPMTVRAFFQARAAEGWKPATIRRSLATIARAPQVWGR